MRPRSAMSLIEILIAMSLFAGVMAALIQSMIGVMKYSNLGEAQDDLNHTGLALARTMADDIYSSG